MATGFTAHSAVLLSSSRWPFSRYDRAFGILPRA
jgi:hypothetical protein